MSKNKKRDKYHYCLVEYKKYLRERFKRKNREKDQLKKEIDQVIKTEDEFYGGGVKNTMRDIKYKKDPRGLWNKDKRKGAKLKKCVFKYAKALEKEEKELKERLKIIKLERVSLKRNLKMVLDTSD